jgi:arylsulfatase A-like enzyme
VRPWSAPASGLLIGVAAGVADAIILIFDIGGNRPNGGVPLLMLAAVVWTWATVVCLAGAILSSPRLGRLRGAVLMIAGPSLLLLSRAAMPIKHAYGWSLSGTLLAWISATAVLCAAGALLRIADRRRSWRWTAAAGLSLALLALAAADLRLADFTEPAAPATKPDTRFNVVLIVLDAARYDDTMSAARNIAAFARTAVTFDRAHSASPWTEPSHFAMFTGRDPWTVPFDMERQRYEYDGTWLAAHFRSRGYATSAIFANNRLTEHEGFGRHFDELTFSRQSGVCRSGLGFLLGYVSQYTPRNPPLCERMDAREVVRRARAFVRRARQPYFLALNLIDPHEPYLVPADCRGRGLELAPYRERRSVLLSKPAAPAPAESFARVHAQYRAAIACMDRRLEPLLRDIDNKRTIVAITADHGEQFGEHGLGSHGQSVWNEVLHVPLILKIPGTAPQRIADPVSTSDLYLSLIRAADPLRARGPMPLLDPRQRRPAVSEFHLFDESGYSVTRGSLTLVRFRNGKELLFDIAADPRQTRPLPITDSPQIASLRSSALRAERSLSRRLEFEALGYLR